MYVVTSETMRHIDTIAIDEMGILGIELMHRAGEAVARISAGFFDEMACKGYIGVFVGPGNNGGDGWVCAKLLKSKNYPVKVFSAVLPNTLSGDAKTAFEEARNASVEYCVIEADSISFQGMEMAIDALLGTGAKGSPRGPIGDFVRMLAVSDIPIIAIDNPTGADADDGTVDGLAIPALATVSLALPKLGQFLYPAREFVGQLFVADIGIPNEAIIRALGTNGFRVDSPADLAALLPFRPGDGHKGTFGKASVIAGSNGMTGAVALTAEAVLRSGAGLVEAVVPEGLVMTVDTLLREAVVRGVPQVARNKCLSVRGLGDIVSFIENSDAIAFGPGIGTHRETVDLTSRLLPRLNKPSVIDADALNCITKLLKRDLPVKFASPVIITPHPGELSRLLDVDIDIISSNRLSHIQKWADMLGVDVLVLKGSPTLISSSDGPVFINRTGNDGMATGGSGDVLTGVIAGFLAQGLLPLDAARLGVYIHGLAGDIASVEIGRRGLIAGDIVDSLPEALRLLEDDLDD